MFKLKQMKPEDQVRLASAVEEVVESMEVQKLQPRDMALPQYAGEKELGPH